MLTNHIAALLLAGSITDAAAAGRTHRRKLLDQKQFHKELYGNSRSSAALRKKFNAKSTFIGRSDRRLQQQNNNGNDGGHWYDKYYENFMNSNQSANNNNNAADGYQANNANAEGMEGDEVEEEQQEKGYGFIPGNYALSYHRCAAVQQLDDEAANGGETMAPFVTKNFAIFRFCPTDTCDAEIVLEEDEEEQDGRRRQRKLEDAAAAGEEEEEGDIEKEEGRSYGKQWGARGGGCRNNYGEYMIELEDYLQIMHESQDDVVEEFCGYCEDYMYQLYMSCLKNGNCRVRRRDLEFEEFKSDTALHRELGINYGICKQYPNVCNGALDDELSDYLECKEVGDVYVGPHCAEDGFTITLGVYADENCNMYTGGNIAEVLGQELDEDALKPWYNSRHGQLDILYEGEEESLCIPCQKEDIDFSTFDQDDNANDDVNYDAYEEAYDQAANEMSELCEAIYEKSAHCHKNYIDFHKGDLTKQEWKEEQRSCAYIESIYMGNYDEEGYVNLQSHWWNWFTASKPQWARDGKYETRASHSSDASALQVFFLCFTILSCIILAVWSKTLHGSLIKKDAPWAPPRRDAWSLNKIFRGQNKAPAVSPADSGIGMSRVQSEGTSYYLT